VSKPAGSSAGLANSTEVKPSFTADADGTYVIELVVNDGTVGSTPATVSITASTANSAPAANAGPDQTVVVGSQVSLDGTGSSDADNDPLTYAWMLVSRPSGSTAALPGSATTEMVFFTPDVAGTYVVQLVVNDGSADSTPDTVTITATAAGPDGAALFSANCAACHGADGTQIVNLRGISASTIEAKMPHKGNTIDSIGGTAGAQAIADFLAQ
jgi:cytochrome c553